MTASTLTSLQTTAATHQNQSAKAPRARSAHSAGHATPARAVRVLAQADRDGNNLESRVQASSGNAAMKLLSAVAAAQLALSGAAVAGINDPVLPGAKVTSKDLPDGPKPLDAVKGSGGADIGGALSKASDKAGKSTPDVKVPGFGPFKFNPKEDAKQAAKKSPIGFLRAPALTLQANDLFLADLPSLPGSNVSKGDLPDGPKFPTSADPAAEAGQAASAVSKASDKAGESTPDVNVPGFGPFKFNPKEDAKQAAKKSPLGLMQANKMFLADLPSLPGSNVSKGDLPDGPKFPTSADPAAEAGQAASAVSKASDKAGENTPDVNVPGFGPFKFNPKEDAKQAAKKSPLGLMQANKMFLADLPSLPGSNVSKGDLPDGPKFPTSADPAAEASQAASAVSKASDKAGESTPDVNVPGFGPFKFNPKEDAKQAAKKSPLGLMQANKMFLADLPNLPGANVSKDDLPDGPKPLGKLGGGNSAGQAASAASSLSEKAGESNPDIDIPGFGTFKGNPKEDAKQAANKASELTSSISTPNVASGLDRAASKVSDVKDDLQEAVNQKGLE